MSSVSPRIPISTTGAAVTPPITFVSAAQEQHMLLLFLPVKSGKAPEAAATANKHFGAGASTDLRIATGVHFAMFYPLKAGVPSTLPVPTFTTAPGKDLLVALSIYDRPFDPYISAFTGNKDIAKLLDLVLGFVDESGIVPPTDPTSVAFILSHGGVGQQNAAFLKMLMRYNFGDPLLPGVTSPANSVSPVKDPKYLLSATFPGMTVGAIFQNYAAAGSLWPWPPAKITYE
jgi:hypothetical protein